MKSILSYSILIIFVLLMFTEIENKSYYAFYGLVIFYCIINIQEEIEKQNK